MPSLSVSVAMATYNGAQFLGEQLDSIAAQTVLPAELVISDDASTDETLEIARGFAERAPFPVHVHSNERQLGYVRNFREAASHCRSDLIAFCDQDDWWLPQRLERCIAHFADPELQLLYHNAWVVDESRRRTGHLYDVEVERRALSLEPLGPWNFSFGLVQMFRGELRQFDDLWDQSVNHTWTADEILPHDLWYFFLAQALGRVDFLDEKLLEYRQHESNAFGATTVRPMVETRLLARVEHWGRQDLRFAKAAESRAHILREIAARSTDRAPRLLDIAARYALLGKRNRRRFRTYSADSAAARLASLARSWARGDYRDWPWGFDRRSVIRDLWSGVLLGKV